jgi:hypothetical protein
VKTFLGEARKLAQEQPHFSVVHNSVAPRFRGGLQAQPETAFSERTSDAMSVSKAWNLSLGCFVVWDVYGRGCGGKNPHRFGAE